MLLNSFFTNSWAAEAFVVKKIEVHGLQRISTDTVYNYLPIQSGEILRPEKTGGIISALYKTGFFERITLSREGNTLIINVVERPTIGQLKISGNSIIPTDKLLMVMKSVDVAEGRVYNRAELDRITQSLLNEYYQLGRYNARLDVTVTPMERNRVKVTIDISEGVVSKIRRINFIGNYAFSESTLEKQLVISTSGLITIFTQTDRYSQEKLDTSLENLRNFYLDHGYLKFATKSSQIEITPDRKSIFITVVISEGESYKIKGITLAGDLILPRSDILKLITIQPGTTFSRQAVINAEKAISNALGNKGYIFAEVSLEPVVDDTHKEVFLTFRVKPGKRVYLWHITFVDNSKTNDVTLRRELEQMESAVVSSEKLEQSKRKLSLLPFIKEVQMSIVPVQNSADQVDVHYKVTEDSAAQMNFSVGYSQRDHIILGAGLNQKNFLGTGKTLGLNASTSPVESYLGINFTDPYYTVDGIRRSISLSASKVDLAKADITRGYTTNQFAGSVVYDLPLGEGAGVFNRLQLGFGYEGTFLGLSDLRSQQVDDFVSRHGHQFHQLDLILGFSRDSRDKAIFPTAGMIHTIGANLFLPLTHNSLKYYMLSYDTHWYYPLTSSFIATARGDVGYGSSFTGGPRDYPFFKNYYAGGMESVRGYESGTLGPKDSLQDPTGGNFLANAGVGLIFPNNISDNLRTTFFADVGNVYNTFDNRNLGGSASGPVRYSIGVEGDWLTPFGLIDVSLSKPLKVLRNPNDTKLGDEEERFQFTLGANFG